MLGRQLRRGARQRKHEHLRHPGPGIGVDRRHRRRRRFRFELRAHLRRHGPVLGFERAGRSGHPRGRHLPDAAGGPGRRQRDGHLPRKRARLRLALGRDGEVLGQQHLRTDRDRDHGRFLVPGRRAEPHRRHGDRRGLGAHLRAARQRHGLLLGVLPLEQLREWLPAQPVGDTRSGGGSERRRRPGVVGRRQLLRPAVRRHGHVLGRRLLRSVRRRDLHLQLSGADQGLEPHRGGRVRHQLDPRLWCLPRRQPRVLGKSIGRRARQRPDGLRPPVDARRRPRRRGLARGPDSAARPQTPATSPRPAPAARAPARRTPRAVPTGARPARSARRQSSPSRRARRTPAR